MTDLTNFPPHALFRLRDLYLKRLDGMEKQCKVLSQFNAVKTGLPPEQQASFEASCRQANGRRLREMEWMIDDLKKTIAEVDRRLLDE